MLLHPRERGTDVGGVAPALTGQDTDPMDGGTLGNAVGSSKNSTCAVGSVSVAVARVVVAVHEVGPLTVASGELLVGSPHPSVHDVDVDPSSGDVVLKVGVEGKAWLVDPV